MHTLTRVPFHFQFIVWKAPWPARPGSDAWCGTTRREADGYQPSCGLESF
jgi:hypothetical protein